MAPFANINEISGLRTRVNFVQLNENADCAHLTSILASNDLLRKCSPRQSRHFLKTFENLWKCSPHRSRHFLKTLKTFENAHLADLVIFWKPIKVKDSKNQCLPHYFAIGNLKTYRMSYFSTKNKKDLLWIWRFHWKQDSRFSGELLSQISSCCREGDAHRRRGQKIRSGPSGRGPDNGARDGKTCRYRRYICAIFS